MLPFAAGLLLAGRPGPAGATGFFIPDASARAVAQGSAVVAGATDASAVFYNPAAIPFLDKDLNLLVGATTYFPQASYENPRTGATTDAEVEAFPVPYAYATYRPVEGLGLGVGLNTRFGLGVTWPEKWEGYHLVEKSQLDSTTLAVVASFAPLDWFSLGVSFDTTFGAAELSRGLDFGAEWGSFRFVGETVGFTASLGAYARPADWVALGLAYHGPTTMTVKDGKADFDVPNRFDTMFPDQGGRVTITAPDIIWIGARFWPCASLSLELDVVQTQWHHYDKLEIEFDRGIGDEPLQTSEVQHNDWHDVLELRLGAAWDTPLQGLSAYLGLIYEGQAVPAHRMDPSLPDNHRVDFSAGLSYAIWHFTIDVAYMFAYTLPREVGTDDGNPFPARYRSQSHVLGTAMSFAY